MTSKQKALEIINQFKGFETANEVVASKQMALTCVYHIINALSTTVNHLTLSNNDYREYFKDMDFWEAVKHEINNHND